MTIQEVLEYTGCEKRFPTEQEVDLVMSKCAAHLLDDKIQKGEKIPLDQLPAALQKQIDESRAEMIATAFVLDFTSIRKRLFFHHQVVIGLQDHDGIKQYLTNAGMANSDNLLGTGFRELVNRSTTPHNHLGMSHHCVLIDANDVITHQQTYYLDVCLSETERSKENK